MSKRVRRSSSIGGIRYPPFQKGVVYPPTSLPDNAPHPDHSPIARLHRQYIYGWSRKGCHGDLLYILNNNNNDNNNNNNINDNNDDEYQMRLVYPSGCCIVILDPINNTQKIHRSHPHDCTCLTLHPKRNIVASGCVGLHAPPQINIFDCDTMKTINCFSPRGVNSGSIIDLSFDASGRYLAVVTSGGRGSSDALLIVYEWNRMEFVSGTSQSLLSNNTSNTSNSSIISSSSVKSKAKTSSLESDSTNKNENEKKRIKSKSKSNVKSNNQRLPKEIAHVPAMKDKVFYVEFTANDEIVVCGGKSIKYFSKNGEKYKKAKVSPKGKIQSSYCLSEDQENKLHFVGTQSGDIYIFRATELISVKSEHQSPVYSIQLINNNNNNNNNKNNENNNNDLNYLISGSKNGELILWSYQRSLSSSSSSSSTTTNNIKVEEKRQLSSGIRTLTSSFKLNNNNDNNNNDNDNEIIVYVGLMNGEIQQINLCLSSSSSTTTKSLIQSHIGSELNAIGTYHSNNLNNNNNNNELNNNELNNNTENNDSHYCSYFATAGEDGNVKMWSLSERRCLKSHQIENNNNNNNNESLKCIDLCAQLRHVCVGSGSGTIYILNDENNNNNNNDEKDDFPIIYKFKIGGTSNTTKRSRSSSSSLKSSSGGNTIHVVRYSPCGRYLAVGAHDANIYLFATPIHEVNTKDDDDDDDDDGRNETMKRGNYKRLSILKGHHSYLTHLDWSQDSKYLKSTCGAYELLFWHILETSYQQVKHPIDVRDVVWSSHTCPLGWSVRSIWPESTEGTEIGAVDTHVISTGSSSDAMIGVMAAASNKDGSVHILNYPSVENRMKRAVYPCHGTRCSNVAFTNDGKHLLSCGGPDLTICQWEVIWQQQHENMPNDTSK